MGKLILFAGKELPAGNDMASGAAFQGRKVIATSLLAREESDQDQPEENPLQNNKTGKILGAFWNKGSALSCRSLALKCDVDRHGDDHTLLLAFGIENRDILLA